MGTARLPGGTGQGGADGVGQPAVGTGDYQLHAGQATGDDVTTATEISARSARRRRVDNHSGKYDS